MSIRTLACLGLTLCIAGCNCCQQNANPPATKPSAANLTPSPEDSVLNLFDGKTLKNWKSSEFGGDGEVKVEDGAIVVGAGASLSGVTWTGFKLPTNNYEIELDAKKISGDDFFLGLTFPYRDKHASLVLGGWGGTMVGISSIDGYDAANNDTACNREFKKNTWFHVRVKCTEEKIEAWVDGEQVVNADVKERKVDVRIDIDNAKPFGMSTYQTVGAYKNIFIKRS